MRLKIKKSLNEYKVNNIITKDDWFDAVNFHKLDLIKKYINSGFDVNCKDKWTNSALTTACDNNDDDLVKELLKHPDIDINIQDNFGNTALILACVNNNLYIVTQLLKHPNINLELKDNENNTALYYAKVNKGTDIIRRLKEAGAKE